jgi:DNA primase
MSNVWPRRGDLGWHGLSWDRLAAVTAAAAAFFTAQRPGSWAVSYLAARGLPPQIWRHWGIGYAPRGWTSLTRYLRGLGFPDEATLTAGLARRTARGTLVDVFRDRVMFPVRTVDGMVAGFIGRAPPGPSPPAVYLNTGSTPLYRKGELLFGLYEGRPALAAGATPVLVEGPFDAIAVTASAPGRFAGLAPCGTALTAAQVALLGDVTDLAATGVVVAFDGDRAGQAAAVRAYELLRDAADVTTTVTLPDGQDPAGYLSQQGAHRLAGLLQDGRQPLADLVIDAKTGEFARWLEYPEGIYNALHATARTIARLPPRDVARQVNRTAERLGLRHEEVTEALIAAIANTI